ncbi:MAG TPA: putative Ig domain-containing protein, partial [Candidatus Acidoferrum sp.]|nr:putative Ig domain-containing protein [Candidatus Acidoferrum sp.]
GTPAYMAPEQFTPHADTDYGKVDIYAVGTTLYKMLTGELPFTAANEFALRDAKLFTDPPKPRSLNPEISKQVEAIVLKAISKEHEDRYATAFEMKQAIDAAAGQAPKSGGAHKTTVQKQERTSAQPPTPRPGGKSKAPLVIGVAVVVVLIAIGGYIMFKPSTAKIQPVLAPIGDQPITAGTSLMFGVTATDADNTTPILSAKDLPPGASFTASTGVFEWTPRAEQVGSHSVVFYATHAKDNSLKDSQVVNITVAAPATPQKPTATVAANPIDTAKPAKVIAQKQSGTTTPETKTPVQPPEKPPTPPLQKFGNVIVVSRPTNGADIYIDGKMQADKTPYTFRNLSAGKHTFKATLVLDGSALEQTQTVEVVADSTSRLNFDFDK